MRGVPGPFLRLDAKPRPAAARPFRLDFTLAMPDTAALDEGFGVSLAAGRDTLVVGGSAKRGVVALFDARTGGLRSLLRNPGAEAEEGFGAAVAASGERIAAGALAEAAVHVYDTRGAHRMALRPRSAADRSGFGRSVAVGAGQIAVGGSTAVHVFDAESARPIRRLDSPLIGLDQFGTAVAYTDNVLLVGAPACHSSVAGRVYAYSASSGALLWTRTGPAPQPDDGFGHALSADGDVVAVGAPGRNGTPPDAAYLLSAHTGTLRRVYRAPPRSRGFGSAVAIRGNRLLVGAPADDATGDVNGAAYLFATRTSLRLAAFRLSRDYLARTGEAVAFAGARIMVGAPGANLVGVFTR